MIRRSRMLIARAVYWLARPMIEAEAQRVAGVALDLAYQNDARVLEFSGGQLRQIAAALGAQDVNNLQLLDQSFGQVLRLLEARAEALPGEERPSRDETPVLHAASKLN